MAKLHGWEPKRRTGTRIHEQVPAYIEDADEWFSFTTFDNGAQLTTRGKLVQRFYEWSDPSDGMKPWVVMKLDPQEGATRHIWWWGHLKDYHSICEQSYFGPHKVHRVKLMYRQVNGNVLWLASAQLGPLYFYSEQKVREAYLEVITQRLWYISEKETERVVAM